MSEHKILDHDPKLGKQIDFTELISYRAGKIKKEAKVTISDFSHDTVQWYGFKTIIFSVAKIGRNLSNF